MVYLVDASRLDRQDVWVMQLLERRDDLKDALLLRQDVRMGRIE